MYLEYNPYTNPNYFESKYNGLYLVAITETEEKFVLLTQGRGTITNMKLNNSEETIYLIVSGMSALPVTVRFE